MQEKMLKLPAFYVVTYKRMFSIAWLQKYMGKNTFFRSATTSNEVEDEENKSGGLPLKY